MMHVTSNQKSALRMLARNVSIPRAVTVEALKLRGLAEGPNHRPKLTAAGRYFEKYGEYPPDYG